MNRVPANVSRFTFEVIGLGDELRVLEFNGNERISGLFQYDIQAVSKNQALDLASAINRPALLTLVDEKKSQLIHGYIWNAEQLDFGKEFSTYRFRIVPGFWYLQHRRSHRIFQDLSVPDIIQQLLKEAGIAANAIKMALNKSYPPRPYCVQYRESEFEFITRLMVEEGIHYHFQHGLDKHLMVISDHNQPFKTIDGKTKVRFNATRNPINDEETIFQFQYRQKVVANKVTLKDYNFEKPSLDLMGFEQSDAGELEHYQHPAMASTSGEAKAYAGERLAELRVFEHLSLLQSDCIRLQPGKLFTLNECPNKGLNQEYLVYCVTQHGSQPQSLEAAAKAGTCTYHSQVEVIPSSTTFKPPREIQALPSLDKFHPLSTPKVDGPQTAIVTGPPGEEIYTDKHGRIKVQFHWDREGQYDEKATCWVRTNQPFAGLNYGGQKIPRVGQEVIIEFEESHPDRPIMLGQCYNGESELPYELPEHKTRTVLKTLSSPKGDGFNEIRIDDKKGEEQLFIHAEKDVDIRVKHDLKFWLKNEEHIEVTKDRYLNVKKDSHQTLDKNHHLNTGKSMSFTIQGDTQIKVKGGYYEQAGQELHLKAGMKAVIESSVGISLKAGSGAISIDPSGVSIQGATVRINQGGSASAAKAPSATGPTIAEEADKDNFGKNEKPRTPKPPHEPKIIDFMRGEATKATLEVAAKKNALFVEKSPKVAANPKADTEKSEQNAATSTSPVPWEAAIWADTPWYEKALVGTGYAFDALNEKLSAVAEWPNDTVEAFDAIGEDPNTPEALRFAVAALKLPARIGTNLVGGVAASASLITNPESREQLVEGVKTLYNHPEIIVDAAKAFADKPAYEQASDVIVLASDLALGGKGAHKVFKKKGKIDDFPDGKPGAAKVKSGDAADKTPDAVTTQAWNVPNNDLRKLIDTEGTINYGSMDAFGRPSGINTIITPNTPKGTPPSGGKTPGFSRAQGHTRGHLLGAQLGGSGSDARNLVTQFPAANANAMSKIEDAVRAEIDLGNVVEYSVSPIYRSEVPIPFRAQNSPFGPKPGYRAEDLIPQGVTIKARSSSGKSFEVSVPNTPDWAKNQKGKFDPEQLWSKN